MVTLNVAGRRPLLGTLAGNERHAHCRLSPLGLEVQEAWYRGGQVYDGVMLLQCQLMPDHLHAIVFFTRHLPFDLGRVVRGFKAACNAAYRRHGLQCDEHPGLWESGYHDRILRREGQLDRLKEYIADNPRRRLVRSLRPDFFTVVHRIEVAGLTLDTQGNRFLLDAPWMVAVRCSRSADVTAERERYLAMARRGAVLVSPSVSPGEKAAMRAAMDCGYPVVFVRPQGFSNFAKPGGRTFDICAAGRFLQVSAWPFTTRPDELDRKRCLAMNAVASALAAGHDATHAAGHDATLAAAEAEVAAGHAAAAEVADEEVATALTAGHDLLQ